MIIYRISGIKSAAVVSLRVSLQEKRRYLFHFNSESLDKNKTYLLNSAYWDITGLEL